MSSIRGSMTLREIIETLQAKVVLDRVGGEVVVERAGASDLMSDVLWKGGHGQGVAVDRTDHSPKRLYGRDGRRGGGLLCPREEARGKNR